MWTIFFLFTCFLCFLLLHISIEFSSQKPNNQKLSEFLSSVLPEYSSNMKTKQKCNIACVVIYCFLTFRNKRKTIHFNVYCSRQYQIFSLGCFACRSLSSVKCYGISSLAPSCASWFLTLKVFLLSFFSAFFFLPQNHA